MTPEAFFGKFDQLSEVPNAVTRLRELIFRLAFSGVLLGRRPGRDGLPQGWQRRTIGSIASSITPGFACSRSHQSEHGHVHLRTHNISTLGTLNFDLMVRIDPQKVDPKKSSIAHGDILFNNTNSQELVGKTCLVDCDYDYAFSNHITRIRLLDNIDPGFVVFYLTFLRNSGHFARLCTRWINQAAVNSDTLKEQTIPLPPSDEQKQIVAKVDELMALCDRLEAQQKERETRHTQLARASLARFAEAPTPANLNFLFHKSYDITPDDLRKTILTLAVRGKLVPRDTEAPLGTLESTLAEASVNGVSTGPTSDSSATEILRISAGTSRRDFFVNEDDFKHVQLAPEDIEKFRLAPGDLLSCRFNGNLHYVGRFSYYRGESGRVQVNPDKLIRFRVNTGSHCPRYVCYAMNAAPTRESIESMCATTAGNIGLSAGRLKSVEIPLPPLPEQRWIVAKVDQLMALVDQLEQQLADSREAGADLLEAVVAELVA